MDGRSHFGAGRGVSSRRDRGGMDSAGAAAISSNHEVLVARASTPDCTRATGRAQGVARDAAGRQRTGWSPPSVRATARRGDPSGARLVERDISATGPTNWVAHLRADLGGVSIPGGGAGWSRRVVGWLICADTRGPGGATWPGSRPWSASCGAAQISQSPRGRLAVFEFCCGAGCSALGYRSPVGIRWQHQRCLAGILAPGARHGRLCTARRVGLRPPEPLPNRDPRVDWCRQRRFPEPLAPAMPAPAWTSNHRHVVVLLFRPITSACAGPIKCEGRSASASSVRRAALTGASGTRRSGEPGSYVRCAVTWLPTHSGKGVIVQARATAAVTAPQDRRSRALRWQKGRAASESASERPAERSPQTPVPPGNP